MKYTKLTTEVNKEARRYFNRSVEYMTTCDSSLERYSTPTRWQQFKNGTITRQQAVNFAKIREEKNRAKETAKKLEKLERISNAEKITSISIFVNWVRNYYWGYNPKVEITVYTENHRYTFEGSASGCGYDKRSAAVAEALNKCDSCLKILYDAKERYIRKNGADYNLDKLNISSNSNRECVGYGAGYGALPYFEGGVGYECFDSIFIKNGYRRTATNSTKNTDFYSYELA